VARRHRCGTRARPCGCWRGEREPIGLDSLDSEAVRYADTADRVAPTGIRNDPIKGDLLLILDRRARRRVCELGSLLNRCGVGGQCPRSVDN
jgi:hypothetical protein